MVRVGFRRQELGVPARPTQLLLGTFVHHDAHVRVLLAQVIIAADVIGVAVRVDDQLDRLVGDLLDLAHDRGAVARHLGVDQRDAVLLHDDQRVPAAAENLVDIVFDVLDRLRRRKRRTRRRRTGRTGRRSALGGIGLLLRRSRSRPGYRQPEMLEQLSSSSRVSRVGASMLPPANMRGQSSDKES